MKALKITSVLVLVAISAMAAGPSIAAQRLSTRQYAFSGYSVNWHKGEGLADSSGKALQALHLEKTDPLAAVGDSSGVSIGGISGTTLTELGFDVRNDGICGESPQIRIYLPGQTEPLPPFTCADGLKSSVPGAEGWTRVRFPAAQGVVVDRMFFRFELPLGITGMTHIDNLDINGSLIGKA